MGKSHFIVKNLIKYHAFYAKVFQPKPSQKHLNFLRQVVIHISFSQQREKILANTGELHFSGYIRFKNILKYSTMQM